MYQHAPVRRIRSFNAVSLTDARLSFIEDSEWVVVHYVQERVLNLCEAEALDEFRNCVRFLVRHLPLNP
jgi:hypothetical protein